MDRLRTLRLNHARLTTAERHKTKQPSQHRGMSPASIVWGLDRRPTTDDRRGDDLNLEFDAIAEANQVEAVHVKHLFVVHTADISLELTTKLAINTASHPSHSSRATLFCTVPLASMRVPFPIALSVGTDLIAFHRLLPRAKPQTSTHHTGLPRNRVVHGSDSKHLQRLAARFLHPQELADLEARFPDWTSIDVTSPTTPNAHGQHRAEAICAWLAGRWAAKEAAKKAWDASLISFKDLRTQILPSGEVEIVCQSYRDAKEAPSHVGAVDGPDQDQHATTMEQVAKLSITHDGEYAMATVIATPLHPDIMADLKQRKENAARKVLYKRPDTAHG